MNFTEIKCCRICQDGHLELICDLGQFYSCGYFLQTKKEDASLVAPLVMVYCNSCGLVQLKHNYDQEDLFRNTYGYRSGLNSSMVNHLSSMVREITNKIPLSKGDYILDIGSNDGTLLKSYPDIGLKIIGIDPSIDQFREFYPDSIEVRADFFTADTFLQIARNNKARVITSISMFYDLPDPNEFVADIAKVLDQEGMWVFEQSYLPFMLERNSFDTICHEHLEYYALKQIVFLLRKHGLRVINVEFNDTNGGSFCVYACHQDAQFSSNVAKIEKILKEEETTLGFGTIANTFESFWGRIESVKEKLLDFLLRCKKLGIKVHGYGASTKGNTLLQYFGVSSDLIEGIADCNSTKWGCFTPGSFIPIISEEASRNMNPDFYMVLPWHFRDNFIVREKTFLEKGGKFIFPLPKFEIVESNEDKKNVQIQSDSTMSAVGVVVGSNGQDGYYLSKYLFNKGYEVFGLNRKTAFKNLSTKIQPIDITDRKSVAEFLQQTKPTEIYYLAAHHRSSEVQENFDSYSEFESSYSVNVGGLLNFLDGIERYSPNTRLFYAASAHIFGDPSQIPQTEKTSFSPNCIYGITKANAIEICKYYRNTKNIFASTGILYNHESPRRNIQFVSRKIVQAAVKIKMGMSNSLTLGDLSAKVDWGAAMDYIVAMHKILSVKKPDDFIVATGELHTIREFADIAFKTVGLNSAHYLREDFSLIRKVKGGQLVGDPIKLKTLTDWSPTLNFKELVVHMVKAELASINSQIEQQEEQVGAEVEVL